VRIRLEPETRPMVQVVFTRRAQQLDLWDTFLNIEKSTLAQRIYAYGVILQAEGPYVCQELGAFEPHPVLRAILNRRILSRRKRERDIILSLWPDEDEADVIDEGTRAIGSCRSRDGLRQCLEEISGQSLPDVARYSLNAGRTWHEVDAGAHDSRSAFHASDVE